MMAHNSPNPIAFASCQSEINPSMTEAAENLDTPNAVEFEAPEKKAKDKAAAAAEEKRAAEAARRSFDAGEPLIAALARGALGGVMLRDAATDSPPEVIDSVDEALTAAEAMTAPMLSLTTTRGEVLALTSQDADPTTATFTVKHDGRSIPVWALVAPLPIEWITQ